jgi:5'-AMP-activated protein kinase catalytic alpha subunit
LHRDIKLDNILLDGESGVKICDFGVSKITKKGVQINEQCGTPAYIAPEIISEQGYEAFHVDMWSLGVLLYAMLCGTVPFKAPNMQELHRLILKGEFKYPVDLSPEAKNVIDNLLKLQPNKRLTIPQILSHPWLKETNDESESDEDEEDNEGEGGVKGGNHSHMNGQPDDVDLK